MGNVSFREGNRKTCLTFVPTSSRLDGLQKKTKNNFQKKTVQTILQTKQVLNKPFVYSTTVTSFTTNKTTNPGLLGQDSVGKRKNTSGFIPQHDETNHPMTDPWDEFGIFSNTIKINHVYIYIFTIHGSSGHDRTYKRH